MTALITTLGRFELEDLGSGIILPHEHIFVDLRQPDVPGHGEAPMQAVVELMAPELERARAAGVVALVASTPEGVGRRADFVQAVSEAAGLPILVPTGVYREPWIPPWIHRASEDTLHQWMIHELNEGIGSTGVRAAWIKLSAGDNGMTECERKVLRAAAAAATETGAVIGSHTIRGRVVLEQLDIIEATGCPPERFIWIHTQAEPDMTLHLEVARRGAWLEYDALGSDNLPDERALALIQHIWDAGFGDQLLLSHDRGWYDAGQPGGGKPKPFTYLPDTFIPKMREAGFSEETIDRLVRLNPFHAFARQLE